MVFEKIHAQKLIDHYIEAYRVNETKLKVR